MKKSDVLYVNNLNCLAKFSWMKWKILIDKKLLKILNKKEIDSLKEHERFHKKFNIPFITLLISFLLFLTYKLGIWIFVINLFTLIKIIIIIIIFMPLIARIIEISADLYSSHKTGRENMIRLLEKTKPKAGLLHPSKRTRLLFINLFSKKEIIKKS
ncbi:MAG: hypothetical protein PHH54_06600 [Candidatus Nanoarchaeia archaeon]|nr:hypothetical protein [Candidatus Nanoarchaeia archaeon]MDD5741626.1 hypothetical protein [Candidatus Nanoarchaeia archaeon]